MRNRKKDITSVFLANLLYQKKKLLKEKRESEKES